MTLEMVVELAADNVSPDDISSARRSVLTSSNASRAFSSPVLAFFAPAFAGGLLKDNLFNTSLS